MEICSFVANAKSKTISVDCKVEICKIPTQECIGFEKKELFSNLCERACKNFNRKWSCPPHAPTFSSISQNWANLYILYMRAPMCCFFKIKNEYLKIKAANSMLKSRADKYMRVLASKHGKCISTGSCRLCKPCKYQTGRPCEHPDLMAYSFEALGIDVEELVNKYFGHPLLWYRRGSLPEYTSVVCGLLTNEELSLETLRKEYFNII